MDKSANMPCREKYWSEIDSDERIERLRLEVKRLIRQLQEAQDKIFKLSVHQHASDGTMLTRFNEPGGGYMPRSNVQGDDVYF